MTLPSYLQPDIELQIGAALNEDGVGVSYYALRYQDDRKEFKRVVYSRV